jgi:hypothetical protein
MPLLCAAAFGRVEWADWFAFPGFRSAPFRTFAPSWATILPPLRDWRASASDGVLLIITDLTTDELVSAHAIFEKRERRFADYWTAVGGVSRGFEEDDSAAVAESVAAFLKSWNWNYYRFQPNKLPLVQADVARLIAQSRSELQRFRARDVGSLEMADRQPILRLFVAFEQRLGPVGTAKSLNVLAPRFFPLWDNPICYAYGVVMAAHGYFLFMSLVKEQIGQIDLPDSLLPLKTLDEYNYCRYTNDWLERKARD